MIEEEDKNSIRNNKGCLSLQRRHETVTAHLFHIQSVSVPCQNFGVGGSHGFLLTSFSNHLNKMLSYRRETALQRAL